MSAVGDADLAPVMERVARARGVRCDAYKSSCFRRRLAVRMRACGVHTYDEYAAVLDGDGAEFDRLLAALTINVSSFYRNASVWDYLRFECLPALWEAGGAVRCWSAGCAAGEEPYTLAMLLLETARAAGRPDPGTSSVLATDLDPEILEAARQAEYREAAFAELPPAWRERWVRPRGNRLVIAPEVRQLVRFAPHDLIRDVPPDPPYDLIVCRNVVIYFDRPIQENLFHRFADALRPGGRLVLGKTETLFGESVRSRLVFDNVRERVYRAQ